MAKQIFTKQGYDFFEVSSSMQKAIRRADHKLAGFFALELFHSGFHNYVWKRLLTISAEDCYGIITQEIEALEHGFYRVNEGKSKKEKGRIFISKAVLILCDVKKSRDSDHLQCLVYDKKLSLSDQEIENYFDEVRKEHPEIPEYAYDVHTIKGKMRGKTKKQFFIEENGALQPKHQPTLFDNLIGGM